LLIWFFEELRIALLLDIFNFSAASRGTKHGMLYAVKIMNQAIAAPRRRGEKQGL
jgi:hypothetical protein